MSDKPIFDPQHPPAWVSDLGPLGPLMVVIVPFILLCFGYDRHGNLRKKRKVRHGK